MAQELEDLGFKNVYALLGGFNGWLAHQYPVESKGEEMPLREAV